MVNYNNNAGLTASPTASIGPDVTPFPAAKGFSPPVPTQSLLADMCKNAGAQPSTRLSVVNPKPAVEPARPVYSAAFSLAAQAPGALSPEFDKAGRQRLTVAQKEKTPAPAAPIPSRSDAPPPQRPNESGCTLTPCISGKDNAAIFPQVEALSTVVTGQSLNFGEALFSENIVIGHEADTDVFRIRDAGIYELCYSLNYEVPVPCVLLFGFEGFPQSYFKQQITQAPTRGKLRATVRLLLDTGTALRLVLVNDPAIPTIESALVSNATLEVKQLYRLNISSEGYSTGDPAKNFRSENSFLPSSRNSP